MRTTFGTVMMVFLTGLSNGQEKSSKVIKPEDARAHAKQNCTVEMVVKSSHYSDRSQTVFLNSEADFKSDKNLTIVLFKDALERFQAVKIEQPADYFKGKKIRVSGRIDVFKERSQIKVNDPSQIEIVDSAKKGEAGTSKAKK